MNQNCSIEYTATDGNGLQSTSTITWTIAPPGNFVIDGGDGSNVSGTVVKQAIANGDPLAITDGNGVATQLFNPLIQPHVHGKTQQAISQQSQFV